MSPFTTDQLRSRHGPKPVIGRATHHWRRSTLRDRHAGRRRTRHTILVLIRGGRSALNVGAVLIDVVSGLPPALGRTLTWDQGNEVFQRERIGSATGISSYFADPHWPWQRGSNENVNRLLRQYFPKGNDLGLVSDKRLRDVADELNDRPRACLDDRTPNSLMSRWRRQLIAS